MTVSGKPRRRRTKAELERARKKAIAARKHHLKKQHRMTPEIYEEIKDFQGGVCPICLRANGRTKALAVEHDHNKGCDHPHKESCPECWRGSVCGPCNSLLAHCRDDVLMLKRAIIYLENPPAQLWRKLQQGEIPYA